VQLNSPGLQIAVPRGPDDVPLALPKPDVNTSVVKFNRDTSTGCRVLIVDRDSMSSDLLATALTRDRNCRASAVSSRDLVRVLGSDRADLVVIGAELESKSGNGFNLAQSVSHTYPSILIVILLNQSSHVSVVNAFRSGARGVFSRQQPMAEFLDCVDHVSKGFIWAGAVETTLLLDAFRCVPLPDFALANDVSRLTERELQVVQCAARGKTNKVIAAELGLSEHTVKNYLFRSFEKMGVSNRVDLLFYLTLRGHSFGPAGADGSGEDVKAG
jgi:DNA-binding NarL/FixJ family response regulator